MALEEEIRKAIGAHGMWKMRLRSAINTGKIDADPAEVAKDNHCAFGQWLYGTSIPATARIGTDYAAVRRLHADFHKCASKVLACVASGNKEQANALMAGEYDKSSGDLTSAMMKWKATSS